MLVAELKAKGKKVDMTMIDLTEPLKRNKKLKRPRKKRKEADC